MAKPKVTTRPITVRFTHEEEKRLRTGLAQRGYATTSALIREALWKELGNSDEAGKDAEQRLAATLERIDRHIYRVTRGQQALFAVVDMLVKSFLTCVPEPSQDSLPQSVARGRDRYARFIKSAGQAMVGDSQAAMEALVNHAD
jgi:hypothetical protein